MNVLLIGFGYIGSYLYPRLTAAGHDVVVCDRRLEGLAGVDAALPCAYQELTVKDFREFDVILWFAGHSSVPMSIKDPDGAVANNCLDLLSLARRKLPQTRLIYASTGSVYSTELSDALSVPPPELAENETKLSPVNPYDCSKISFDALARCFASNVVGLRLGTVCGHAPKLRAELIFNAMNRSAIERRFVPVANVHAWRSILFLDDLAHYVLALMEVRDELPQIINAGTQNVTIGELALAIADFHGVPTVRQPDAKTYSFRMNCDRMRALCGPPRSVSIAQRCKEFSASYPACHVELAS